MEDFATSHSAELIHNLTLLDNEHIPVASMIYCDAQLTVGRISVLQNSLAAEELEYTRAMSVKRRREFIAGRTAARLSMLHSGYQPSAILREPGGAPIWPNGVSGSLTHNDRLAAAVIVDTSVSISIGIDLEENVPLPDELFNIVLTPSEYVGWSSLPNEEATTRAKIFFSAKEAVFKTDWPCHGEFLEFADIEISQISNEVLIGRVKTFTSNPRNYFINVACSTRTIVTISQTKPAYKVDSEDVF